MARDVFCAIDFETATYERDSACAVGIVRVEDGQVTREAHTLIRPRGGAVLPFFARLHGITTSHVRDAAPFADAWRKLQPILRGAQFLAAHNARFDRDVLHESCRGAAMPIPRREFRCTVEIARERWGIYPTKLPNVCEHLGIPLTRHHDALADARACAEIILRAHNNASPPASPKTNPNPRRTAGRT